MKLLVVGAGAVGSLLAARLSAAGDAVEITARAEHVAAVRRSGLRVEGTDAGTFRLSAFAELSDASVPDALLLTVKTFDLAATATAVARRFRAPVPTLLPQNGLGIEGGVEESLRVAGWPDPRASLVRAVNSIPVTFVGPGVVRQAGEGAILLRDPADGGASASATSTFATVLRRAGIPLRLVHDLDRELWRKALVNAAINPVTALRRVPNGRLLESPYREEAVGLLREAERVAAAEGFEFSHDEADRALEQVARATAENRSSMLQDLDRGRPTEVDAISGEIVRRALTHGIDVPRTRDVVARLSAGRPASQAT